MECSGLHHTPALYAMDHRMLCPDHRFSGACNAGGVRNYFFSSLKLPGERASLPCRLAPIAGSLKVLRNAFPVPSYSFFRCETYYTMLWMNVNRNFSKNVMPLSIGSTGFAEPMGRVKHIKRRCEITIISFSRSIYRWGLAALIGVTGKPYPSCLSCHSALVNKNWTRN